MSAPTQSIHIQVAGTPLTLLAPEPAAMQARYRAQQAEGVEPEAPYWSRLWPSALALADWLAQHPEWIRGKKVLELAAGLGLPSLWAAREAGHVTGSDYLPEAVDQLAQNAAQLGLRNYDVRLLDWNGVPPDLSADVLLLSDVNYAPSAFPALIALTHRFVAAGTEVLLATPERSMGAPFIEAISKHIVEGELVQVEGAAVRLYRLSGSH